MRELRRKLIVAGSFFFLIMLFVSLEESSAFARGFLRVKGEKVVDSSSREVRLRGFNVSFKYFRSTLGEKDIEKIAGLGADCIRLALDYRDFETSPFRYREDSFSLLSRVLGWAQRYGVYVILDMHLAPGFQNPHDFFFHREKAYRFWSGKKYQKRYYALLSEFARRYGKREMLAAYDLLNEGVPPDLGEYKAVMNRAADAIRAIDKDHILIVEEAIMTDGRKELSLINDDNTIYSIHFYLPGQFSGKKTFTPADKSDLISRLDYALTFKRRFNVPVYLGEFTAHVGPSEQSIVSYLEDLLQIAENADLHWTYWEYYSDYPGIIAVSSSDPAALRSKVIKVLERHLTIRKQPGIKNRVQRILNPVGLRQS